MFGLAAVVLVLTLSGMYWRDTLSRKRRIPVAVTRDRG
ncbi:hypothetical protein GGE07_000652 [Sinorhizobium terangae]|nr:hypothetical protein [Sinorhizobium terangae]